MNSNKNLLLLICFFGLSSLAFAGLDITFNQVNAQGAIVSSDSDTSRLLAGNDYACTMILYSKENIQSNGGLLAFLNIYGPPYDGSVNDLDTLRSSPSYLHNLYRIVYQGANCDCTVTVYQGTQGTGKSKNYYSTTAVDSSEQTKIDIDYCWANKAESLTITCSA